eukprot:1365718-Prymnesium_polylepis.1
MHTSRLCGHATSIFISSPSPPRARSGSASCRTRRILGAEQHADLRAAQDEAVGTRELEPRRNALVGPPARLRHNVLAQLVVDDAAMHERAVVVRWDERLERVGHGPQPVRVECTLHRVSRRQQPSGASHRTCRRRGP